MKIAVLGLGSIGLRHAKNLQKLGAEVIGYDTDETKMREFQGKKYKREDLIPQSVAKDTPKQDQNCDAYLIATPTAEHYNDLLDCMAETKPVFVEKPIAGENWEQLQNFHSTQKLSVGYMLRFHPCVNFAKERISNELIGKPLWASFTVAQFNDKPAYLADGVVLNWSHEIDLALYFFGPAKVACASIAYRDGQDVIADFVLKHESGVRSTIHMDYVTKQEIREAWIVGTEKNIGLDLVGRTASWGRMVQQFDGTWDSDYLNEMASWLAALEGKETVLATGQDGIEVVKICEQIKEIADDGRWSDLHD